MCWHHKHFPTDPPQLETVPTHTSLPSVISAVEQAPTIRAGADFELPPLPVSCLRHKFLQPCFDVSDLWGWFWEELDSMPINPSSAHLERGECPGKVSFLSQDCSARALCKGRWRTPTVVFNSSSSWAYTAIHSLEWDRERIWGIKVRKHPG